jgi:hypothetical protein
MSTSTYLKVCGASAVAWALGLLFVPPFAQAVEGLLLLFLSTNAR